MKQEDKVEEKCVVFLSVRIFEQFIKWILEASFRFHLWFSFWWSASSQTLCVFLFEFIKNGEKFEIFVAIIVSIFSDCVNDHTFVFSLLLFKFSVFLFFSRNSPFNRLFLSLFFVVVDLGYCFTLFVWHSMSLVVCYYRNRCLQSLLHFYLLVNTWRTVFMCRQRDACVFKLVSLHNSKKKKKKFCFALF